MIVAGAAVDEVTLSAGATLPINSYLTWWVSNNAGTTWLLAQLGRPVLFSTADNRFMWRANLSSTSAALSPRVNSLTITATDKLPDAPTDGTISFAGTTATVSWTPPTNTGGGPIVQSTVTHPTAGTVIALAPDTSATFVGLDPNADHTFTITVTNTFGTSAPATSLWPPPPPPTTTTTTTTTTAPPASSSGGAWLVSSTGRIFSYGDAPDPPPGTQTLSADDVVAAAATDDGGGWLAFADGAVEAFGGATHHGDMSGVALNGEILAMSPRPDGTGYWLLGSDGGIFAFGKAPFFGSTGALTVAAPIIDLAPTPSGGGYWLLGAEGAVFSFGNATYHGGPNAIAGGLNKPASSISAGVNGYWIIADDGGIFAYTEPYHGSLPGLYPNATLPDAVRIRALPNSTGYYIVTDDGTLYSFGAVPDVQPNRPSLAPGETIVDLILFT